VSKKLDKWNSAKGIMDELHRIREQSYKERRRIGTEAWLKNINSASKRLGLKVRRQSPARSSEAKSAGRS
jgi:hypothetical protein